VCSYRIERGSLLTFFRKFRGVALAVLIAAAWGSARADDTGIVINEIMYNPPGREENTEYVELYNRGDVAVDLTDWSFADGIEFTFPAATVLAPGEYLVVARYAEGIRATYGVTNVIGDFEGRLRNGGETVAVQDVSQTLIDTVTYGDSLPWPETPDGDGPSLELIDPDAENDESGNWAASIEPYPTGSPGVQNSVFGTAPVPGLDDIVINEIMYNPSAVQGTDVQHEFVELYNRGSQTVDLSGWSFTDGITYRFDTGTTVGPGGYLVVCADPGVFPPGIDKVGPFEGRLSNSGERVTLQTGGKMQAVADSVRYTDGWAWPTEPDGTGRSLERRNPYIDHDGPGNWVPSGSEGTASMRIVATGPGGDGANDVSQLIYYAPSGGSGRTATISFWARPVSGNRTLRIEYRGSQPPGGSEPDSSTGAGVFGTLELRGRWRHFERSTLARDGRIVFYLTGAGECLIDDVRLVVDGQNLIKNGDFEKAWPFRWDSDGTHFDSYRDITHSCQSDFGSPGTANSALTSDVPLPDIDYEGRVPDGRVTSADEVAVLVSVNSAVAVSSVNLLYTTDWAGYSALPMSDDGVHEDGDAGDGVYGARIPASADLRLVRWFVEVTDTDDRTVTYPRDAPMYTESYFVVDSDPVTPLPVYRCIVSPGNWLDLTSRDLFSDDEVEAFFCYGSDARRVGLRYRGGVHSRRADKKAFRVRFDSNRSFREFDELGDVVKMNLHADHQDETSLRTALVYGFMRDNGLIVPRTQHIHLRMDHGFGDQFMGVYTQVEAVDEQYLARDSNFNNDSGNLYKSVLTTFEYQGTDPTPYRCEFDKTTNEDEDEWTDLIALYRAFSTTPDEQFKEVMDGCVHMQSFFDYMAHNVALASWDNYMIPGSSFRHNFFLYNVELDGDNGTQGPRFYWLPWDYDEALEPPFWHLGEDLAGRNARRGPTPPPEPYPEFTTRVIANAEYAATYRATIHRLLFLHFTEDNMFPRVDALYDHIRADVYADPYKEFSTTEFEQAIVALKAMVTRRRDYLLGLSDLPELPIAVGDVDTIDFGELGVDQSPSAPLSVTIANAGNAVLHFVGPGVAITADDADEFRFASGPDTSSLDPGERREIDVVFEPLTVGDKSGMLTISTDDAVVPTIEVELSGTAVPAGGEGEGEGEGEGAPCDANGDGIVNAVDVQLVINAALGIATSYPTDVNGVDGTNAVDVQLVINGALGLDG